VDGPWLCCRQRKCSRYHGLDWEHKVSRSFPLRRCDGLLTRHDFRWFGTAEGRDGYDAIEHIAALDWCSGKTALVGNSWLAMAQWFIAAEQPPSLTCIAPLEGCSDFYRETLCRGGVPNTPFWQLICSSLFGKF
jgi:hypothetical protein